MKTKFGPEEEEKWKSWDGWSLRKSDPHHLRWWGEIHQIWRQPNSDSNKQGKLDINIQYNKFKRKGAVKNTHFDKYL